MEFDTPTSKIPKWHLKNSDAIFLKIKNVLNILTSSIITLKE